MPDTKNAVTVVTEALHNNCCFGDDDSCAWLAELELTPCRNEDGTYKYLGHEMAVVEALRNAGLLREGA